MESILEIEVSKVEKRHEREREKERLCVYVSERNREREREKEGGGKIVIGKRCSSRSVCFTRRHLGVLYLPRHIANVPKCQEKKSSNSFYVEQGMMRESKNQLKMFATFGRVDVRERERDPKGETYRNTSS